MKQNRSEKHAGEARGQAQRDASWRIANVCFRPIADIPFQWDDRRGGTVTQFEYLFTLFGLLLGFILIEVLSGLVRTVQARHPTGPGTNVEIHLGWLTPLLGAFVLLDITGWWGNVWSVRHTLPLGYDTLFGGVILCGVYYFAASMVFPDEPKVWLNHDEWFWLHRRQVLGCILAANLVWAPIVLADPGYHFELGEAANISVYFGSLIIALWAHRRWLVTGALALLVLESLALGAVDFITRQQGA